MEVLPAAWVKNPDEFERFKKLVQARLGKGEHTEEEDDMNKGLGYPEWAWRELDGYVSNVLGDKIITDKTWVEKVRKKKSQLQLNEKGITACIAILLQM